MNLVTGEWIPVLYNGELYTRVSLRRFFQEADQIMDLAVDPPQRVAMMRFLICITQAALDGPKDIDDWKKCKGVITSKVSDYLQAHFKHFELYGEKPFMQVPTLKQTYNAAIDKLDFGLAHGGACPLYDHGSNETGREHDEGWIALMLITYQSFCPGGTIGVTKWGNQSTQPGKEKGPGSSSEAVCVEQSALHTFIRAANMLDTVHQNLLTKELIVKMPNTTWGKPTWEIDLSNSEDTELRESVLTYLGRLCPLTRAILLSPGNKKCTLANGLKYPRFPEYRETTATVRKQNKNNFGYVQTSIERHPWREINSLLAVGSEVSGALALKNLKGQHTDQTIEIWTGGMVVKPGQYKILDSLEWTFGVPLNMIGNAGPLAYYQAGVVHAKKAESNLLGSVKEYARNMKMEKAPTSKARLHFWSHVDQNYEQLLETANDPSISLDAQWTPLLRKTMRSAYQAACPCTTPRQIQAFAAGQAKLKLPNAEKENA